MEVAKSAGLRASCHGSGRRWRVREAAEAMVRARLVRDIRIGHELSIECPSGALTEPNSRSTPQALRRGQVVPRVPFPVPLLASVHHHRCAPLTVPQARSPLFHGAYAVFAVERAVLNVGAQARWPSVKFNHPCREMNN